MGKRTLIASERILLATPFLKNLSVAQAFFLFVSSRDGKSQVYQARQAHVYCYSVCWVPVYASRRTLDSADIGVGFCCKWLRLSTIVASKKQSRDPQKRVLTPALSSLFGAKMYAGAFSSVLSVNPAPSLQAAWSCLDRSHVVTPV